MIKNTKHYVPRTDESKTAHFTRSGRFFCQNERWYFKTREGLNYGPYFNKIECRYAYDEFIEMVSNTATLISLKSDYGETQQGEPWKVPNISFN